MTAPPPTTATTRRYLWHSPPCGSPRCPPCPRHQVSHQNKLYLSAQHEKMHFGKLSPGPCAPYQIGASVGPQKESKDASQPSWGFGSQASRRPAMSSYGYTAIQRYPLYIYTALYSIQYSAIQCTRHTSPLCLPFCSQDRWHTYNKELKANTTPGPGAYDPSA